MRSSILAWMIYCASKIYSIIMLFYSKNSLFIQNGIAG